MGFKESKENDTQSDWPKWSLAFVLLLAGLISNHYYSDISQPIRLIGWAVVLAGFGFLASKTIKGQTIIVLFRDSRMELRKVVWPTREETIQTTLVVAAMVVILALIMWGMDGILVWLIGFLAGRSIS
ncbi:MAG: preprotein translocase subunit SecE [Gammaproteobacteria bacterium RIFCSPHIGHO2_12_FULL_42_10]|nr:MAG: preprotein translocase subunit SecE [Gammaproteobacteria bacterium RIFCSPHIGHO2_12_FULL_42_10]